MHKGCASAPHVRRSQEGTTGRTERRAGPNERMVSVRRSPFAEDSTRTREAIAEGDSEISWGPKAAGRYPNSAKRSSQIGDREACAAGVASSRTSIIPALHWGRFSNRSARCWRTRAPAPLLWPRAFTSKRIELKAWSMTGERSGDCRPLGLRSVALISVRLFLNSLV